MLQKCYDIENMCTGGQKTVLKAKHDPIGLVVIKTGVFSNTASGERISREVKILEAIQSPYYPQQYYFSIDPYLKKFEIIEGFVEGNMLRDVMQKYQTPQEILKLLSRLIDGLSIIWDKNIVHRDLKPENIIIRSNETPCIIDLGIARFLDLDGLTNEFAPFGPCTPAYAAPEQLNNQISLISPRTDFFAIGIIALELYLGFNPFMTDGLNDLHSIVDNIRNNVYLTHTDTIQESVELTELTSKLLQTQPYLRHRNYQQLKEHIQGLML